MHIDPLLINLLGFVATLFSVLMWIPQAATTWRNRNDTVRLAGISETTQWLTMMGALVWGVFGVLSESFWVAAPSLVSLPLSLATIAVVRRSRGMRHVTISVPILSTSEPEPLSDRTGSLPILSTSEPEFVSDRTGSIPIISTGSSDVDLTGTPVASPVLAALTGPVAVFA